MFTYPDGHTYVGEWSNDKRHGLGTSVAPNGAQYFGTWGDGLPEKLIKFSPDGVQLEAGTYNYKFQLKAAI